jgi:putative nucleotidyltransferase with HDIG domain
VLTRAHALRPRLATAIAWIGFSACVVWFVLADHSRLLDPLTLTLLGFVVLARLAVVRWSGSLVVSGSFIGSMLAIGFLGPAAVFVIDTTGELWTFANERYRRRVLPINLFAVVAPGMAGAALMQQANPDHGAFYLLFAAVAAGAMTLNFLIVVVLVRMVDDEPLGNLFEPFAKMAPVAGINVVMALAAAGIYETVGIAGALFLLVAIVAFTYMARLVVKAEERAENAREQATIASERTRQYAALSWGVLSGLIRTLNERDPRAARHAAAVAAFARDIAAEVGMSERDRELAHTAGLLHDIGRFGLSDRVMERDVKLTDEDWRSIRRHPALGADMLKDLGVYGPVADIVRTHHERIDGRGYPDKLDSHEIPEIAKIVAVAEVYDTLTADDTYREPVSSFQALTELRRVSGTQLDGRYVEALSALLTGRSTDYRHADAADFDSELDLERRLTAAGSPAEPAEAPTARTA